MSHNNYPSLVTSFNWHEPLNTSRIYLCNVPYEWCTESRRKALADLLGTPVFMQLGYDAPSYKGTHKLWRSHYSFTINELESDIDLTPQQISNLKIAVGNFFSPKDVGTQIGTQIVDKP